MMLGLTIHLAIAIGAQQQVFDLDRPDGVTAAARSFPRSSKHPDRPPLILLVAANALGLPNAVRLRRMISRVDDAPSMLVISPEASTCAEPASQPCAHSARFGFAGKAWSVILCLRQYFLARFFEAGADVVQLDSDVMVMRSPFDLIRSAYRDASVVVQNDHPLANSGLLLAQHVNASADLVTRWMLVEWWQRLLVTTADGLGMGGRHTGSRMAYANDQATGRVAFAQHGVGRAAFAQHGVGRVTRPCLVRAAEHYAMSCYEQATLNDVLQGAAVGCNRYTMGLVIPRTRTRARKCSA